ncbi:putative sugar phosphate isomerase involved in capsule formation [Gilliamella apicola SCGC AB-598-I20]|nr:putative sugar phosphate isomerase involved in capsule formation [Gilliamella apicola SCGC AB-598-I20]
MDSVKIAHLAAIELANVLSKIDEHQVDDLINKLTNCNNIFVLGAGRSLLMMKAFAMRLMHVGFHVHVVGEVTTPALQKGDVLIIASGSGETQNLVSIAQRAKNYGGSVIAMSIFENSSLANIADQLVKIPAYSDKLPESENNKKGILPGGSMFEEALLLLCDAVIIHFINNKKICTEQGFEKHANLE